MEYKGYTITAEIETYEQWSLDEDGDLAEFIGDNDGFAITGYHFDHKSGNDAFFETVSDLDVETLHQLIDAHIEELKK